MLLWCEVWASAFRNGEVEEPVQKLAVSVFNQGQAGACCSRPVHAAAARCSPSPCMQSRHPHTCQLTHPSMLSNTPHHPLRDDHRVMNRKTKVYYTKTNSAKLGLMWNLPASYFWRESSRQLPTGTIKNFKREKVQPSTKPPPYYNNFIKKSIFKMLQ